MVHRRLRLDAKPEHLALLDHLLVEEVVVRVQPDGHAERGLRTPHARDVVQVGVCQQNGGNRELEPGHDFEKLIDLVAGIDHNSDARLLAADDEAILEERGGGSVLQDHPSTGTANL